MRALPLLLLLLLLPLGAAAGPDDDLRHARDLFEYGDYEQARQIAAELLERNVLASDDQLIDANRIVALAWFYGDSPDRLAKAERHFLQLLSIEPEYRLDPFFTTPAAIQFFEEVKRAHEKDLAPIREQRRRAREARRAEEEARRRFLEAQQNPADPAAVQVHRNNFALVFLPLGAGQFQNGDTSRGMTLAAIQIVAGLTSAISYFTIEEMRGDGGFSRAEVQTARALDVVKWSTAALFYAAWGYGVVDAWIHYTPEVRRPVAAPVEAPAPAPPSAASDGPRLAPHVAPIPGGGLVGIGLDF